jgi:long-chain acyl-CoA synthetase
VTGDDLAAIVYTSGTTGKPKGVMLTHRNILANIKAVVARVPVMESDVFLSFLPLSHTFERTIGYYLPVAAGSCVAYVRSVGQIAEDLKIVRPTVLVSVPRIYEKFYAKLQEMLAQSNAVTRLLFQTAQAVGWRRFSRRQGLPGSENGSASIDALLWPMLEALVARKVLAQFGGRLRAAVSGGAPMSQAVAQCFLGLGVPMLQGYGMTETAPVVAANSLDDNWPTTVGRAIDGVQVRIGENNELQVRAESVMKGYWNRPEDTRRATTDDGWLRTGDQAVIEEGRIRISGRIKEIMVTSTGEKIAPADLELAIMSDPLFDQALVVGENRPFISAYVVLNRDLWAEVAKSLQLDPADPASLKTTAARQLLIARIKETTKQFPYYAVPRAVWATLDAWTVENSMMTPTLKLKRNNLHARLSAEIEAIYR